MAAEHGKRHAAELDKVLAGGAGDYAAILAVLTEAERHVAALYRADAYVKWVMVGVMVYHLEASIELARRA